MKPEVWAKKIVDYQGWEKAYSIASSTGREWLKMGIRNPHAAFFNAARQWMRKNAPVDLSQITIQVQTDEPDQRNTA